jgi:hypothetical protein
MTVEMRKKTAAAQEKTENIDLRAQTHSAMYREMFLNQNPLLFVSHVYGILLNCLFYTNIIKR